MHPSTRASVKSRQSQHSTATGVRPSISGSTTAKSTTTITTLGDDDVTLKMSKLLQAAPHQSKYHNMGDECHPVVDPDQLLHPKEGPSVLLKKSLRTYFDDRVDDVITEKFPSANKPTPWSYAIATEAAQASQEIACLDSKLSQARTEWASVKKSQEKRWKSASDRNLEIFVHLQKFNERYKDLFEKRKRYATLLVRETEQGFLKDQEMRLKQKQFDKLTQVKKLQEERVAKFSLFHKYLEQVKVSSEGEYTDVRDIVDKYNALAGTRDELEERVQHLQNTMTRRQVEIENDVEVKATKDKLLREYLSDLIQYDAALRKNVFNIENTLKQLKMSADQRTAVIGQLKMTIYNLYEQSCRVLHRNANLKVDDPVGQLIDIRKAIKEITRLSQDIKRMVKLAHLTAEEEAIARDKIRRIQEARQQKLEKLSKNQAKSNVFGIFSFPKQKEQREVELSMIFPALENILFK